MPAANSDRRAMAHRPPSTPSHLTLSGLKKYFGSRRTTRRRRRNAATSASTRPACSQRPVCGAVSPRTYPQIPGSPCTTSTSTVRPTNSSTPTGCQGHRDRRHLRRHPFRRCVRESRFTRVVRLSHDQPRLGVRTRSDRTLRACPWHVPAPHRRTTLEPDRLLDRSRGSIRLVSRP